MRTLRIFIGKPQVEGHPLRLYAQDTRSDWNEKPLAEAWIPLDLAVPNPPLNPLDGTPLQAAGLRALLLAERGASESFKAIGTYLYQLLQQGDVGTVWQELRQKSKAEGLRTVLDIEAEDDPKSKQEDLRRLPWELMKDGPMSLYIDETSTLIRGSIRFDAIAPKENWPLRALIVIACPKEDPIQAEKEQYAIEQALLTLGRQIDVEFLIRQPQAKVADRLRNFKPHLFHFIGHARNAGDAIGAVLVFYREDKNKEEEWDVDTLLAHLGKWQPRFVFLNACRSSDPFGQAQSYALTDAFRIAGVPAVIGMQGDIEGSAAATLAANFYAKLTEDVSLDRALGEARHEVMTTYGLNRRDWALPILCLDVPPEQVLPMKFDDYANAKPRVSVIKQFADHRPFVGRDETRRLLWTCADPWMPDSKPKKLLIISGEESVGKSALVHWCMEGCAYRGIPLQYVRIKRHDLDKTKDYVETLRAIRDGDGVSDPYISAPLSTTAFRQFNWQLNHWLQNKEPDVVLPDGEIADEGIKRRDGTDESFEINPGGSFNKKEATGTKICKAFRMALEESARLQGDSLLLILDKIQIAPEHFYRYLLPDLIQPIAADPASRIRIILVVTNDQYRDFHLSDVQHLAHTELIDSFPAEKAESLLQEFSRVGWSPLMEKEIEAISTVANLTPPKWLAGDFFPLIKILLEKARKGQPKP